MKNGRLLQIFLNIVPSLDKVTNVEFFEHDQHIIVEWGDTFISIRDPNPPGAWRPADLERLWVRTKEREHVKTPGKWIKSPMADLIKKRMIEQMGS